MACCKPCCGCQECAEGQQGKCCCPSQGPDGTCCSEGEYCCSGVCQPEPCADCDADEDCCVCGAIFFLGDPCPDGWTRADAPYGEWYCVSPELPMPCGNRTQECEDIRQQLIDATGSDVDYAEGAAGYCCDGECSAEECPP